MNNNIKAMKIKRYRARLIGNDLPADLGVRIKSIAKKLNRY